MKLTNHPITRGVSPSVLSSVRVICVLAVAMSGVFLGKVALTAQVSISPRGSAFLACLVFGVVAAAGLGVFVPRLNRAGLFRHVGVGAAAAACLAAALQLVGLSPVPSGQIVDGALLLLAATSEEVVFRALLPVAVFGALSSRLGITARLVLSLCLAQVCFALAHAPFHQPSPVRATAELARLFAGGIAFSVLYHVSSLSTVIVCHWLLNAALIFRTLRDPPVSAVNQVAVAVFVLLVLGSAIRARYFGRAHLSHVRGG